MLRGEVVTYLNLTDLDGKDIWVCAFHVTAMTEERVAHENGTFRNATVIHTIGGQRFNVQEGLDFWDGILESLKWSWTP